MYNWLSHLFTANFLGLNRMSTIFKMPAPYAAAYQSYFYANDGDWLNPAKNPEPVSYTHLSLALALAR